MIKSGIIAFPANHREVPANWEKMIKKSIRLDFNRMKLTLF